MKKSLLFLLLGFISQQALSQEIQIQIHAGNKLVSDSIEQVSADFISELKKSRSFDFSYSGKGGRRQRTMVFAHRASAGDAGIHYPKALRSFNPEGYYIQSDENRIYFVGNSALALQQAIFDYLEQLGFRYFMPGEAWEVIPAISSPFIKYEKLTQPFFESRILANGQGYYKNKVVEDDFNAWAKANRLGGFFLLRIGHVYQTIVSDNAEVFKKHPEYFAGDVKKGTLPVIPKFDVSNKNLVNLVVSDAKRRMEVYKKTGQHTNMISMEPSDGGGYCTSPDCQKIGGVSDQVFYLTNAVAKALRKDYPGLWVGSLAYNEHISPTKFELEPNVFVMVTNGFNRTNYTTNELLKKWGGKATKLGVYEYLSVYAWDNDLPGRSNATQLDFLKKSIRGYYENGARAYLGETTIGWVSKGLGQYVTSKLLWDYRLDVDSLAEDFYSKAFGKAAPHIKQLYRSWEKNSGGLISDNDIADWLQLVRESELSVTDNKIKARLDYFKTYLHYLVLYKKLKANPTTDNLYNVMGFAYRTFDMSAFATVPVMATLPFYSGFKGYGLYDKKEHPWMKDKRQVNAKELNAMFSHDLKEVKRVEGLRAFDYEKEFSKPAKPVLSPKMKPGNTAPSFTGETNFIIRINKKSENNFLNIKSGYAARPPDAKQVTIKVYRYLQYMELKEEADVVFSASQGEKMKDKLVSLRSLEPGDYLVRVEDQFKMFSLKFSEPIAYSVIMNPEKILLTSSVTGLNTFYFDVAPGVKKIIVHKSKVLKLMSPAGRVLDFTKNVQESITVDIKENESGLWQIFAQAGNLHIEGVSPYLGVEPAKMLLPAQAKQ